MKNFKSKQRKAVILAGTNTGTSKVSNINNNGNKKPVNRGDKDRICDICAQNVPGPARVKIFAFGKCDHQVCYVCSTRLRVVCKVFECPICRDKLENVVFSSKIQPYAKYTLEDCIYDEKYNIYFEDKIVKETFDKLLMYQCQECLKNKTKLNKKTPNKIKGEPQQRRKPNSIAEFPGDSSSGIAKGNEDDFQNSPVTSDMVDSIFPDVPGLQAHLWIVHKLKLCDLCLTHNDLFPFEYSYYNNSSLKRHTEEGEPKTPHHGHPKCELCRTIFFNSDECLSHMARDHYYCHLCERHDPEKRIYFLQYGGLREHFKKSHFLCEKGDCQHEQFTSAFGDILEFQVHQVTVHGSSTSNLSRGEARQQNTITLDPAPHRPRPTISPSRSLRQNLPPNAAIVSTGFVATANRDRIQRPESNILTQQMQQIQQQARQQRLPTRAEFPSLGNVSTSASSSQTVQHNNYPTLGQSNSERASGASVLSHRLVAGPSSSSNSFVRSAGGGYRPAEQLNEMDFPPLPEQPKPKVTKKPKTQTSTRARVDPSNLTLEQLISSSLTLKNNKMNGKKSGSKGGGGTKSGKTAKQKPFKIQLS